MENKLRDEDLNLNIIVNGDKSKKELGDLEKSTRELTARNKELRIEKEKLIRAGKQESDEFKAVTKEITENNRVLKTNETRMTELRKAIGLAALTMGQLRSEQTRLKRLMDSSTPGTEQWKLFKSQLEKVEGQMEKNRKGGERMHLSLGKMADGFNRYFAMISVWVASLTGVIFGFKKASNEFAMFDDKVADVQKTTGLAKDEVLALDKSLQNLDTRTAQNDLLDLAKIAGKLGLSAEPDVEGFVRAADKIAVALTEDLGGNIEESINDIGKLTDIFKLNEDYGIEASMIKVGSTINALGAASTANEGYIVEFTKRVAGIAPSAGISIEKVMGLAATLDQFGQSSEVASTVYAQVVPHMFKDTATYAAIAKMSVSDFKDLLNKDANEAFIRFLAGLNGNNGGLAEMTQKLDGLGLEGKRSISVLGVLANNTETLREQQDLSAKSFEQGTSLITEFNIKNETMQARLDKSKKALALITRELGENLSPAMLVSTNGITYFIKGAVQAIRIFTQYKGTIIGAAVGIAAYTIAVKLAAKWDTIHYGYLVVKTAITKAYAWVVGVLTGEVTLATVAQNAWNIAQKANPIGLIIGLLTAAATAYFIFKGKVKEATVEQKKFNDEMERGKELMGQTKTIEERARVMATMNARQLEEFKGNLEDQIKAEEDFHGKLLTEAQKTLDADAKLQELYNNRKADGLSEMQKIMINALIAGRKRELVRELQDQDNASQARLKQLRKYQSDADKISKSGGGNDDTPLSDKELKDRLDKVEAANNKEMALINKRHLEGISSEDQYNDELLNQEIKFLTEKMTVYKKGSKEYEEAFNQSLEKQVQAEKRIKDLLISAEKELAEAKIENLVDGIEKEKAQENQRWSDEKRGLEKQLLDKKDLSDQEAALNAAINATIEEKERLHQDKLRKLKEASKIGDLENLVTAATPVDPNFATLEQQQSFFDARQALIEAQYAKEKQLAGKNQTALKAAERRYNSQMYQLKSDQIDAEYALNEKRIGLAQNYVSMLSGVVDEESALGKALFLFNQGLAVAEVWVNIAKANAKAIAASPLTFGQPWVAANTVQGGIQTGIILAQTIAKFSKKGKKDGGFTGPASSDDQPMGVYHANEWFANAKAVRNPEVKQFLDIFDYYQRTGQISKLNTKMILANLPVQQMYVGGYSSKNTSSSGSGSTVPSTIPTSGGMSDTQLDRLNAVLDRLDSKDFSIAIETYERKKDNWKKITNGGLK